MNPLTSILDLIKRNSSRKHQNTPIVIDKTHLKQDKASPTLHPGDFVRWRGYNQEELKKRFDFASSFNPGFSFSFEQFVSDHKATVSSSPYYGRVICANGQRKMALDSLMFHNFEGLHLDYIFCGDWWKLHPNLGDASIEEYVHVEQKEVFNHLENKLLSLESWVKGARTNPSQVWQKFLDICILPRYYYDAQPSNNEKKLVGCIQARKIFRLAEVCNLLCLGADDAKNYPLNEMHSRPNTGFYVLALTNGSRDLKPKQIMAVVKYKNETGKQLDENSVADHIDKIYPNLFSDEEYGHGHGFPIAFEIPEFALDLVSEFIEVNIPLPTKINNIHPQNIKALKLTDRLSLEK